MIFRCVFEFHLHYIEWCLHGPNDHFAILELFSKEENTQFRLFLTEFLIISSIFFHILPPTVLYTKSDSNLSIKRQKKTNLCLIKSKTAWEVCFPFLIFSMRTSSPLSLGPWINSLDVVQQSREKRTQKFDAKKPAVADLLPSFSFFRGSIADCTSEGRVTSTLAEGWGFGGSKSLSKTTTGSALDFFLRLNIILINWWRFLFFQRICEMPLNHMED